MNSQAFIGSTQNLRQISVENCPLLEIQTKLMLENITNSATSRSLSSDPAHMTSSANSTTASNSTSSIDNTNKTSETTDGKQVPTAVNKTLLMADSFSTDNLGEMTKPMSLQKRHNDYHQSDYQQQHHEQQQRILASSQKSLLANGLTGVKIFYVLGSLLLVLIALNSVFKYTSARRYTFDSHRRRRRVYQANNILDCHNSMLDCPLNAHHLDDKSGANYADGIASSCAGDDETDANNLTQHSADDNHTTDFNDGDQEISIISCDNGGSDSRTINASNEDLVATNESSASRSAMKEVSTVIPEIEFHGYQGNDRDTNIDYANMAVDGENVFALCERPNHVIQAKQADEIGICGEDHHNNSANMDIANSDYVHQDQEQLQQTNSPEANYQSTDAKLVLSSNESITNGTIDIISAHHYDGAIMDESIRLNCPDCISQSAETNAISDGLHLSYPTCCSNEQDHHQHNDHSHHPIETLETLHSQIMSASYEPGHENCDHYIY